MTNARKVDRREFLEARWGYLASLRDDGATLAEMIEAVNVQDSSHVRALLASWDHWRNETPSSQGGSSVKVHYVLALRLDRNECTVEIESDEGTFVVSVTPPPGKGKLRPLFEAIVVRMQEMGLPSYDGQLPTSSQGGSS